MTTTIRNSIAVQGDLESTANNVADALSALACLDFDEVGIRYGAEYGTVLLLDVIAAALNGVAPRDRRSFVDPDVVSEEAHVALSEIARDRHDGNLNDALEDAIQTLAGSAQPQSASTHEPCNVIPLALTADEVASIRAATQPGVDVEAWAAGVIQEHLAKLTGEAGS